ncbi:TSUP family transporter [Staphylococcus massiliensis]|uniref:sulfite exporter TauE/SafE family protein n=1 Tax=Staphylococcus massiliensis TaxID=555791 RepID=UPI001EDFD102|nr:TSUP family transporter [Staphylococcus massiliensis]MCG3402365.1 TSUP family transporter [Staphylococcus massiliensis]
MDLDMIIIIILFGFLSAFIDSVVDGGGLISIPALLAIGLHPATALGTNKLASSFGSLTSAITFIRARKVDLHIVKKLFPLSFIGSVFGALIATRIPPELLKPLVIIMLFLVLIYTLVKKEWGETSTYQKLPPKKAIIFAAFVFIIGMYDGFLGGGTGSFFLFLLLIVGFDFLKAAGNAKVINFASNVGAIILFACLQHVDYKVGLIMGISMIAGSFAGSQFAIRKGVSYVKFLFIGVTLILLLKNVYDYVMKHFL